MFLNLKNNYSLGVNNFSPESNTVELFTLIDSLNLNFKESLKFALLLHTTDQIQTLSNNLDWSKIEN